MKINTEPDREPDAAALLPHSDDPDTLGLRVVGELARHKPERRPFGELLSGAIWMCSCEMGGQHLPPVRTAAGWEAHALGHVAAAMLGLPGNEGVIASVHYAHQQRLAHGRLGAES